MNVDVAFLFHRELWAKHIHLDSSNKFDVTNICLKSTKDNSDVLMLTCWIVILSTCPLVPEGQENIFTHLLSVLTLRILLSLIFNLIYHGIVQYVFIKIKTVLNIYTLVYQHIFNKRNCYEDKINSVLKLAFLVEREKIIITIRKEKKY